MDKHEKQKTGIFQGAGYLIGFLLGAVAGILAVILTGIHGLIGVIAAAVAIPSGLLLERKFQNKAAENGKTGRKGYTLLIIFELILFIICFFMAI
jgi:4-hydroxybenzoate polyprenyltransferase